MEPKYVLVYEIQSKRPNGGCFRWHVELYEMHQAAVEAMNALQPNAFFRYRNIMLSKVEKRGPEECDSFELPPSSRPECDR